MSAQGFFVLNGLNAVTTVKVTAKTLIKDAFDDIGSYEPGEALDPEDAATGLTALNRMLGTWANQRLMIFSQVFESFTLTVGTNSYSIGSGATWDTERPQRIEAAYIRDSNGNDYPLELITDRAEYDRIVDKDLGRRPTRLYYDPQFPNGIVYLDSAPIDADTIFLINWKTLTTFTLTDVVNLPPGYDEALEYNLAIRLGIKYSRPVSPEVAALARGTMQTIKDFNHKAALMDTGLPVDNLLGNWDINTGKYI